jgi:sulfur dioxygenase
VTTVDEERRFNPRFCGDCNEGDFTGYMNHLGLPHPKLMDIAVPANLRCGKPEDAALANAVPADPAWADLTWTFAGLWEIQPQALEDAMPAPLLVDVREPREFNGPLGHIRGALSVPLAALPTRMSELDHQRPVVAVCRSGTRSAQAVQLLAKAGFAQTANLAGGMLRWRAQGQPTEGGAD